MLKSIDSQNLFEKLPDPFSISQTQINSSYQSLYDKLNDSFKNNDFHRIYNLLDNSQNISHILQFKPSNDIFLNDFVKLLYQIIILYPVKYYTTQLSAVSFLNEFLTRNKKINNLVLEWRPFYKVMKYYTLSNESFFIRGSNFCQANLGKNKLLNCFFELSLKISKYFPDEIELENDGNRIETNTTEQLVKKFIPHISANGQYTTAYLTYFRALCPPHKGRYHLYIDFLIRELRDTSKYQCAESILAMIQQAIQCNIEDDFSFLLPVITELISTKIFQYKTSDYPNRDVASARFYQADFQQPTIQSLPNIVIALFISPPTRKSILELLESFFVSFKSVCHPSVSSYNPFKLIIFIDHIVCSLRKSLRKLSSKKVPKFTFNMKEELGPSKDEIHKLLSMTSEVKILNINECSLYEPILIETTLDPSTIDHYFEIGFQCINMMDAYGVARSGWTILTALINSIDKNEVYRDNFETIFEMAVNNLYRPEIQLTIAHFLSVTFSKIPFNKEKTLKGCEYFNFTSLAYSFFSNLLAVLRSLPSINGEESKLNHNFSESIIFSIITMLQNCDKDVMEELLPLFTSLPYDTDIAQSYYFVEIMTANYCFFASQKQAAAIAKAFKRQLDLPNNHSMFYFLSIIYSTALISNLKTIESVKQTTDVFLKFTKSDDEKVRRIAWKSIAYSLSIFYRIVNVTVALKPDKMNGNPLESANLEDFEIKWNKDPDLSDLAFEIFDPLLEKLMTADSSTDINKLLNDIGDEISYVLQLIPQFNDGHIKDEVNEVIVDPIHNISEVYKKTPLREKFIKCANRIIKDFPENEKIVTHAINSCLCLFYPYTNTHNNSIRESMRLLNEFSLRYNHSDNYYNSCFLFNALVTKYNSRKHLLLIPLTDNIKQLITNIADLLDSKYQSVQKSSSNLLQILLPFYPQFSKSIIEKMINNVDSIQFNTFINFFSLQPILDFILNNNDLLCKTMIIILNNSDFKDKEHLIKLKKFMLNICINGFPFETPKSNNQEYLNLLTKIEEKYLNQNQNNRTYQYILMSVILMCLKRVYTISDKILEFIFERFIQYDQEISDIAEVCLSNVLNRKVKFTKEKIEVKNFPNIASFPNVLDQVSVKFKDGGVYFPVTLKTFSSKELLFELTEEYQPEKLTESNGHIDNTMIEISKDVAKVFDSFKSIEIDWKIKDEDKIFDTEYLFDQSNGYFMYRNSFYHKKFEFNNDQILLKNIPLLLASAANLINEGNIYTCLRYHYIWEQIALNVGPNCIDQLNRLLVNYLTQYYSMNATVTSKILFDLISGFMKSVCYWNIEDRIKFFKLVVLPAVCIISLNKNTAPFAEHIITMGNIHSNPFCFAPLIKVLYELSPKAPSYPLFSRYLISIISKQPSIRPFQFYNSIDQLKDRYIVPFINEMDYYNINDVDDIINLVFSLIDCCSFSDTKSPIYTNKIESKKSEMIKILENILEKNAKKLKLKRILIRVLTLAFNCFNESSYDLRLNIAPVFVNHLHTIFNLLSSSNIKDEERSINSFSLFIGNTIFINNTEIEFNFVSLLIKEMMNSSLPMQLILLESLNKMLESNIFNIPKNDYEKYEKLFLDYGEFENAKNLGNELRMKIAKILGIFEIRNCTLNCDIVKEKVDQNSINNEVLKAASIILNSYLFDRADDRVTKSFDLMDECCSIKNIKNREFFKNVSKIFINRHSEHVINEAENMVIQYKNLLTPSYLC